MSDAYAQVKAVFDRFGVPESVWIPIAFAESSLNAKAKGDNGRSIGLFQINLDTQGRGYTEAQLYDPVFNAEIAARAIAPAYAAIKSQYDRTQIAAEVARRSGHPGGSIANPFNQNDKRIAHIREIARQYEGGYLSNLKITNRSIILGDKPPDEAKIDLDALGAIGKFFSDLQTRIANFDPAGAGLVVSGAVLIVIALVALVSEQKAGIVSGAVKAIAR